MTIPDSITFSSIDIGERARTIYNNIEQLAQSIEDHGLIQPIVLVPTGYDSDYDIWPITFGLDAGGRRYHALKHLLETDRWDGVLHHATTSDKSRPGFVLKGADQSTPLDRLMTELAENLDREDMDWRDEVKLINRAWTLARADADSKSEKLLMRDFGSMLGCGYADLQASTSIYDDLVANPERYKDVSGIRAAYTKLLEVNRIELTKLQATKSLMTAPLSTKSIFRSGP